MNVLAIDPSINDLGWATYSSATEDYNWGLVHPEGEESNKLDTLVLRICNCFASLQKRIPISGPINHLVCEYPTFFDNDRGKTAAKQGYTNDLAYICGFFAGRLNLKPHQIHLYTPSEWKGNIPKTGIEFRFRRVFGTESAIKTTDHEQEATMLLRHYLKTHNHIQ